jgi:hypothetical protein
VDSSKDPSEHYGSCCYGGNFPHDKVSSIISWKKYIFCNVIDGGIYSLLG